METKLQFDQWEYALLLCQMIMSESGKSIFRRVSEVNSWRKPSEIDAPGSNQARVWMTASYIVRTGRRPVVLGKILNFTEDELCGYP